jgi:hypothetical protein
VTHAHNQLIVSQSFDDLEFFHESPPIDKTSITRVFFELRRCAVSREFAQLGARDQKTRERGKDDQLEQATAPAAVRCSFARKPLQNLSSLIKCNREKIDNRSQQRNCASIRPMNKHGT